MTRKTFSRPAPRPTPSREQLDKAMHGRPPGGRNRAGDTPAERAAFVQRVTLGK